MKLGAGGVAVIAEVAVWARYIGNVLHTSFPTLDRVALPERTSGTAELLRSTFPIMLSVLQDSAAIAKLSGRKTQSFPIFFLSQLPESTHSLKCIYLKYELCIYGKEAGFSKCPVYFFSLICWTTNLIHWSGFMQTLLSISFCTKSWCIMYRVWKWIKLHLEMVWVFFFFLSKQKPAGFLLLPFLTLLAQSRHMDCVFSKLPSTQCFLSVFFFCQKAWNVKHFN